MQPSLMLLDVLHYLLLPDTSCTTGPSAGLTTRTSSWSPDCSRCVTTFLIWSKAKWPGRQFWAWKATFAPSMTMVGGLERRPSHCVKRLKSCALRSRSAAMLERPSKNADHSGGPRSIAWDSQRNFSNLERYAGEGTACWAG